jgi:hypothetical protein
MKNLKKFFLISTLITISSANLALAMDNQNPTNNIAANSTPDPVETITNQMQQTNLSDSDSGSDMHLTDVESDDNNDIPNAFETDTDTNNDEQPQQVGDITVNPEPQEGEEINAQDLNNDEDANIQNLNNDDTGNDWQSQQEDVLDQQQNNQMTPAEQTAFNQASIAALVQLLHAFSSAP